MDPLGNPPNATASAAPNCPEGGIQESREAIAHLLLAAFSAQERQAATEEAHRQRTVQLAVVAHELLNPLTPIRTAAALLGRAPPETLPRLQSIIEHQVSRLSSLVRDLLDLSRISIDKLRLDIAVVDMAEIVAKAVDACQLVALRRAQRLLLDLPTCALLVQGDQTRLSQVVANLLDNASKYTPVGGEIRVSMAVVATNLVMTVSDDGIGITAQALPHVFEPFVQDAHAVEYDTAGLGIGLSVVRQLVEAHDGSVVAHSDGPGRGTQIIVTLPLEEPACCSSAAAATPGAAHRTSSMRPTTLVK